MRLNLIWGFLSVAISCCFLLLSTVLAAEDKVTAREGTFVAYDNGVVKDTKTGLEWFVGPDRDTTWDEASTWVRKLSVDGGGWRMPTKEELETLYQMGAGTRNMNPLLKTTGWVVWSGDTKDSSAAWLFLFVEGYGNWSILNSSHYLRGFAVRSRK